jgi:abortive infection bacteriophage resistance protein
MDVGDHDDAARVLRRISYYRLSGYWYSFRQRTDEGRGDTFYQGTRLGWGGLTRLYGFAPRSTQDAIAGRCGLRAPQLSSWLKALNIVRNVCAHHGRLYNRVHTLPSVRDWP